MDNIYVHDIVKHCPFFPVCQKQNQDCALAWTVCHKTLSLPVEKQQHQGHVKMLLCVASLCGDIFSHDLFLA